MTTSPRGPPNPLFSPPLHRVTLIQTSPPSPSPAPRRTTLQHSHPDSSPPPLRCPLSSLSNIDDHFCFKYQLPGEDLDALFSVTNDQDLNHMMLEYDCLHRSATKPTTRLRVFSFIRPKKACDSPEVRHIVPIDESFDFDAIGFPSLHL